MPEKGENFFQKGNHGDGVDAKPKRSLTARVLYGEPDESILRNPEYQAFLPRLRELYSQTWRWHGAGRYHHHGSAVIDVLGEIVGHNGLTPHEDVYDYTRGPVYSISTAKTRTYATLYAQLHYERGKRLRSPFQTMAAWFYYLSSTAIEAAKHDPRLFNKEFREQINLDKKGGERFHRKYTKGEVLGKDMMQGGVSDIPENYPMLIGIRQGTFQEAVIAPALRKHESRSEDPFFCQDLRISKFQRLMLMKLNSCYGQRIKMEFPLYQLNGGRNFVNRYPNPFSKRGCP